MSIIYVYLLIFTYNFYIIATATSEILKKLSISIENFPQKCQNILQKVAESQSEMEIEELDPIAISLHYSKEMSDKLQDEYEILKLKQKNAELQAKIDHNRKFIKDFRKELHCSKNSLMSQSINPNNIEDHMRQLKQKLVSYEESCEKAQVRIYFIQMNAACLGDVLIFNQF